MQSLVFWIALLCIVTTYMSLWYGVARYVGRYDVVDSAWGLGFVLVAWISLLLRGNTGPLQMVSATLVSLWGFRLFAHIANRNWRKHEDDHRYQAIRQKWGRLADRKTYTNIFLLQGFLLIGVSAPMIAIAFSHKTTNPGVYIGWTIWLAGIVFEAVADQQLATFVRRRPKGSHAIMNIGLWRFSRHPNYFGEVTTWWGASIVALSLGAWWGLLGAVLITLLITKISGIPPLEKHYEKNKEYEAYRQSTSVLIPLPPKKPHTV